MLVTLCKIGEVQFRMLGTDGFHIKVENERLTAAGLRFLQNLEYENFTSSFGRLRQKSHQKVCRTCNTILFPRSTNQITDLCYSRHFLNS